MGKAAKGTTLRIGDGAATEAFTTVYQVRDISGGGESIDSEDVTHQLSDMEEVVGTIIRGGELTFQVNDNPRNATHSTAGLRGDLRAGTDRHFKLNRPASTSTGWDIVAFTALVQSLSPSYALGSALFADVTLKPHTDLATWSTAPTSSG